MQAGEVAARIQHTNVRPEATRADIEQLLDECLEHHFHAAMVNPIWVPLAKERLTGSSVEVCTALDFPMGGGTTWAVSAAAAEVARLGAAQIDMMTKVGWLKTGMDAEYRDHLASVVAAADGIPVKAMLETALLTDSELARAVNLCVDAGIAYVKNSSGFGGGNATVDLVRRLVELASGRVAVKASGGIKDLASAAAMLEAGAALLGSSGSVTILTGSSARGDY